MTFLPIVERELRVRARQKATFRVRMGAAVVACLVLFFFLFATGAMFSPSRTGQGAFWILSVLAFIWCLLEGPRNTADALSEEKREGTLGLLFLTDLKGYDVVLGKLLATSLNSFYGVLAILPPLGVPLLLGGVTAGEFWRMVLLLIVTLLFSLTASLLISSASRDERRAWFCAALLVGFLAAVPPLFRWVPLPSTVLLGALSPTPALYSLQDAVFDRRPESYWYSVMGVHGLSWAFLVAACLVLPLSWQDKPTQKANRELKVGNRLRREVDRRRSMHLNPVVWMLTRGKRADWYVWAVIASVAVPATIIAATWKSAGVLFIPFIIAAVALNFLLAVWVAAKACFMISDARTSGALDLLMTTPISPVQVINGHMEALKRQFIAPFVALSVAEVGIVALLDINTAGELALAVVLTMVAAGLMGAQLMAVAWFGLWTGLTSKKSAHAVAKTILWVLVGPMLLIWCWCVWPVLTIVKDAIFINYARNRLHQQFRNIITEGVQLKPMPWSRPRPWPPKLPNVLDK
jgi:ABC-type transport system involved in multi-copper enzyme maturation permease subunit